jgi:hypothetical protein
MVFLPNSSLRAHTSGRRAISLKNIAMGEKVNGVSNVSYGKKDCIIGKAGTRGLFRINP